METQQNNLEKLIDMNNESFFREKRFFVNEKHEQYKSIFSVPNLGLDNYSLNLYLKLGFVPGNKTLFKNIEYPLYKGSSSSSLKEIFDQIPNNTVSKVELKKIILNAISAHYIPGSKCIVPLSGGMDSRIILAALCEFTDATSIETYTFGVPGAYDYEIPNAIARKLGTQHTNFSAEHTKYTIDGLIRAAIASDGNTEVFHPLVLNRIVDHYSSDAVFWSGFAGDLVGGAFGNKLEGSNPKQQLINYEKRDIHFLDDVVDDELLYPYITMGEKMDEFVSKSEACFWENHVERYTGHHIFRNDMNIKAPLVDLSLLKFFFTLSDNERKDKKYFNEAFSSIFPQVFDFPTKDYGYKYSRYNFLQPLHKTKFYLSTLGWRFSPKIFTHPNAAYIDMQHAINNRPDVRNCIDELLADLAKRNIVDNTRMFSFLTEHRNDRKNYTKDLINLASLEVILKAAKL